MLIALTGTPGTGKTSVSKILIEKGLKVINLNNLAISKNFVSGQDSKRESAIIDTVKLNDYINKNFNANETIIFESHLSHLLKCMDKIIILRCHPKELQKRLEKKMWKKEKILENVEAEILDVILVETTELHKKENIFEIDTTNKTTLQTAEDIKSILKNNIKDYLIGRIDWSEEVLRWY
jgi:adenylate kinase